MRETTASADPSSCADVAADLNRLLRLDHESIQAYGAANRALEEERHKLTLIRYRGDHQRHIVELARLIRRYGGEPLDPRELPAGSFQRGIQAVAQVGGEREVLSPSGAMRRRSGMSTAGWPEHPYRMMRPS